MRISHEINLSHKILVGWSRYQQMIMCRSPGVIAGFIRNGNNGPEKIIPLFICECFSAVAKFRRSVVIFHLMITVPYLDGGLLHRGDAIFVKDFSAEDRNVTGSSFNSQIVSHRGTSPVERTDNVSSGLTIADIFF